MIITEQQTKSALWVPEWYELDQPVVLGTARRYWFYQTPPSDIPEAYEYDFVFFNHANSAVCCQVREAVVTRIEHPQLGLINEIATDGLDYVFSTESLGEVVVNAEESPGSAYGSASDITDWCIFVSLSSLSQPLVESD